MKKIILLSLFCFFAFSFAVAQSDESKQAPRVYRPDIPGSFKIDWGFHIPMNPPTNFSTSFFPTNAFNLYYQYPVRIAKSNFSFSPGAGISFERYKFDNGVILKRSGQRYELVPGSTYYKGIHKTILSARYIDIPLEFRYDTK